MSVRLKLTLSYAGILAGHMLAPLTRITGAARMAANGSLAHRIQLEGRKDEFRELADTFDTMLGRLGALVSEQQRFAANASHQLRTPLAITQTLLDVARNDPSRDTAELVDRLHAVNSRAINLTEALLLLSRANQRSFTRERVDLSLVAEEATETLPPLAEERGLTVETSGDLTPTIGSSELLLQLTTNLGERFRRSAERTRTGPDQEGVGLGLAIVKSITQAHDGTLTLTPRAAGGASRHGGAVRRPPLGRP